MKNSNKITIIDQNNNKLKAKILFTFNENGDDFVLYELNENVYAAKWKNKSELKSIEKDEWKIIEKIYEDYIDSQEKVKENDK